MDYLREGIGLRGFAQIDPLVAYKNEGFEMFSALMNSIWEEFARYIFRVEVQIEGENGGGAAAPNQPQPWAPSGNSSSTQNFSYAGGTAADQPSAIAAAAAAAGAGEEAAELLPHVETRHVDEHDRVGRNDPCWCGSGKKFKKCHGAG
jgi:preprotein translocase subunit SecA